MVRTKQLKLPGVVVGTGLRFGPAKVLLLIPNRPDILADELVKDFVHETTKSISRSRIPNMVDIFMESQRRLCDAC